MGLWSPHTVHTPNNQLYTWTGRCTCPVAVMVTAGLKHAVLHVLYARRTVWCVVCPHATYSTCTKLGHCWLPEICHNNQQIPKWLSYSLSSVPQLLIVSTCRCWRVGAWF